MTADRVVALAAVDVRLDAGDAALLARVAAALSVGLPVVANTASGDHTPARRSLRASLRAHGAMIQAGDRCRPGSIAARTSPGSVGMRTPFMP